MFDKFVRVRTKTPELMLASGVFTSISMCSIVIRSERWPNPGHD